MLKASLLLVLTVSFLQAATLPELERKKRAYTPWADWALTVRNTKDTPDSFTCADLMWITAHDECEMAQELLEQHNDVRTEYNTETAADCPQNAVGELVWDSSLARLAQLWANMCTWGHGDLYTECNGENLSFGQNVYWSTTDYENAQSNMLVDVVSAWKNQEKPFTDLCTHACSGPVCGHYLQLVAKNIAAVGCAYTDPEHACTKSYYQDDTVLGRVDSQMDTYYRAMGVPFPDKHAINQGVLIKLYMASSTRRRIDGDYSYIIRN